MAEYVHGIKEVKVVFTRDLILDHSDMSTKDLQSRKERVREGSMRGSWLHSPALYDGEGATS